MTVAIAETVPVCIARRDTRTLPQNVAVDAAGAFVDARSGARLARAVAHNIAPQMARLFPGGNHDNLSVALGHNLGNIDRRQSHADNLGCAAAQASSEDGDGGVELPDARRDAFNHSHWIVGPQPINQLVAGRAVSEHHGGARVADEHNVANRFWRKRRNHNHLCVCAFNNLGNLNVGQKHLRDRVAVAKQVNALNRHCRSLLAVDRQHAVDGARHVVREPVEGGNALAVVRDEHNRTNRVFSDNMPPRSHFNGFCCLRDNLKHWHAGKLNPNNCAAPGCKRDAGDLDCRAALAGFRAHNIDSTVGPSVYLSDDDAACAGQHNVAQLCGLVVRQCKHNSNHGRGSRGGWRC